MHPVYGSEQGTLATTRRSHNGCDPVLFDPGTNIGNSCLILIVSH